MPELNQDLKDLIASLASRNVEFLVVGSTVLAFYGRPRYTEDLDLWVRATSENVQRLREAFREFGLPVDEAVLRPFAEKARQMIVLGAAPQAVDIVNFIDGLVFDEAWSNRNQAELAGVTVSFLSAEDFIKTKKASGRPKDIADLALLAEVMDFEN